MASSDIQQLLDHPRRNLGVGIISALLFLVVGLPAYDELGRAQESEKALGIELTEVKHSVKNIDALKNRLAASNTGSATNQAITPEVALNLRESAVNVIRARSCRLVRVTLGDAVSRVWGKNDDPLSPNTPKDSDDSELQLITQKLNLSVTGTMPKLSRLIQDASKLHPFAVPTRMVIKQSGQNDELHLDFELTMIHLERQTQ